MATTSGYSVAPPAVPTVALVAGGNLTTGTTYGYALTFQTVFGQTDWRSCTTSIAVASSGMAASITDIPVPPSTNINAVNIYRTTAADTTTYFLVTSLQAGQTTFVDTLADSALGVAAVDGNFAGSMQRMAGYVGFTKPILCSVSTFATAGSVMLSSEVNIFNTASAAVFTAQLPAIDDNLIGMRVVVTSNGTGDVTVSTDPSQSFGGTVGGTFVVGDTSVTTALLSRAEFIAVSGTDWELVCYNQSAI